MSQDRDSIIERAAQASFVNAFDENRWYLLSDTERESARRNMEAALVAVNVIPPKPAPTRGEAMAERIVQVCPSMGVLWFRSHDKETGQVLSATDDARLLSLIREYIAAAIDHCVADALAAHTPAVDAARLERIAEEAVYTFDGESLTLDDGNESWGLRMPGVGVKAAVQNVRRILVSLMRKSIEGGNSK